MTLRIKKAYRHFNAFLQRYQCRQAFWRRVQEQANNVGLPYQHLKTKLIYCNRPQDWIFQAFHWSSNPLDKTTLTWNALDTLWCKYARNHDYFM